MKKKVLTVFLIFIFFVIFTLIVLKIKDYNTYKKSLKGEKLDNYIYHYSIKGEEDYYIPIEIKDGNIYYISKNEKTYDLYKHNIRSEKPTLIGTFKGENAYCSFSFDSTISCSNDKEYYYDYKLNLIYSKPYEYNRNNMIQLIYYQGRFLTLDNKILYENGEPIKELNIDSEDAYPTNNIIINDNTYLIFYSPSEKSYIYYDIKNDKYKKQSDGLYLKYNNGVYSTKTDEITIYNLITGELKKYDNIILSSKVYTNALKDNMYYFLDNSKLYIVDLENNIISKVNHEFDSNISQILYDDEFIYLLNRNNDCDIYVVDTNKVDKITYTIQEFNKYMDDSVDNRVKAIEDKYHIDLVYKEDVNIKDDTFTFKHITNNYVILDSLNTIENVLKKFNTEFFDSFKDKNHEKGLVIYLSGKLSPNDSVDTTSNPMGYTLYKDDSYAMIVDIESYALKNTICHELMHNIEHKIWDVFPYNEWYNNNPMYFNYMYTYKEDADTKFTMLDENKNLVCFVDQYSKSLPTEDIARIFENICSYDNHTQLLDYPHLKDKALLLKETIEKYFPSLKKSDVFNSLNE